MPDNLEPINPEQLPFEHNTPPNYVESEARYIIDQQAEALAKEKLKGNRQNRKERKLYANLVFTLISIWLTLVLVLFIAYGRGFLHYSDTVIITLLTTTTANVIVVFHFVMKYLFSPNE